MLPEDLGDERLPPFAYPTPQGSPRNEAVDIPVAGETPQVSPHNVQEAGIPSSLLQEGNEQTGEGVEREEEGAEREEEGVIEAPNLEFWNAGTGQPLTRDELRDQQRAQLLRDQRRPVTTDGVDGPHLCDHGGVICCTASLLCCGVASLFMLQPSCCCDAMGHVMGGGFRR